MVRHNNKLFFFCKRINNLAQLCINLAQFKKKKNPNHLLIIFLINLVYKTHTLIAVSFHIKLQSKYFICCRQSRVRAIQLLISLLSSYFSFHLTRASHHFGNHVNSQSYEKFRGRAY